MSLNAHEIEGVIGVLATELPGCSLRKVISPRDPDRIVAELRTPGQNHFLQIVVTANTSRLGRIPEKPRAAESPHPFVMLLRREAVGMSLRSIEQINRDRVVKINFTKHDRTASLVIELTSRHGNIFWLDGDDTIIGSFHINRSHKRQLVPGKKYIPPFDHPSKIPDTNDRFTARSDIEQQIESHYLAREQSITENAHRIDVKRLLSRALKRFNRLKENLERDMERAKESTRLQELGHLLKANLHVVKKGLKSIEVSDWSGATQVIPLDPKLDPIANMQLFFEKSKRLRRAVPIIGDRFELISKKLELINTMLLEIDECGDIRVREIEHDLSTLIPNLGDQKTSGRQRVTPRLPYREYVISNGRAARVGRGARDNDELTLRHARPDDLWLHVRGRSGSHVVVPLGRGEEPTPELLIDAAHLAAHFSDARGDSDVEIMFTRRRYVQKPRGAAPGAVRVIKEKTIALRCEAERLKRILG